MTLVYSVLVISLLRAILAASETSALLSFTSGPPPRRRLITTFLQEKHIIEKKENFKQPQCTTFHTNILYEYHAILPQTFFKINKAPLKEHQHHCFQFHKHFNHVPKVPIQTIKSLNFIKQVIIMNLTDLSGLV